MNPPETLREWLAEGFLPLALLCVFLALGGLVLLVAGVMRRQRLARAREGRDVTSFVENLVARGYDDTLCRITYLYLRDHENIAFPILPEDRFDEDLGLSDEERDQMFHALLLSSDREFRPGFTQPPLTVLELLRNLQASPCRMQLAA